MNIAIYATKGGLRLLTNEGLKVGDKVFPLVQSYHTAGKLFVVSIPRFEKDDPYSVSACTGWPDEPHTILDFYSQDGLQWVHTNAGYSPVGVYFKDITDEIRAKEAADGRG
jgi:hypothetical protein